MNLSQAEQEALHSLRSLFGEAAGKPQIDPDSLAAAELARHIRGLLAEATHEEKLSITDLAKRIGVSKSAVSRHLNSDGDIRASTMAIIGRALGRKFVVDLVREEKFAHPNVNYTTSGASTLHNPVIMRPMFSGMTQGTKVNPKTDATCMSVGYY